MTATAALVKQPQGDNDATQAWYNFCSFQSTEIQWWSKGKKFDAYIKLTQNTLREVPNLENLNMLFTNLMYKVPTIACTRWS